MVKAFAAEDREVARLEGAARDLFPSRMRNVRIQARLVPFIQVLPSFGMAGLLFFGGQMALDGRITLGTFLAFNAYLLALAALARMLTMALAAGQMARAGAVRILELLDSTPQATCASTSCAATSVWSSRTASCFPPPSATTSPTAGRRRPTNR